MLSYILTDAGGSHLTHTLTVIRSKKVELGDAYDCSGTQENVSVN